MNFSLSAAIRLGSMLKPQGFGAAHNEEGTCALGAAMDAAGLSGIGWYPVFDHWPIAKVRVAYPGVKYAPPDRTMLLGSACWILNDTDKWTREQIADWVQSIEDAQVSPDPACGRSTDTPEIGVPTSVGVVATQK